MSAVYKKERWGAKIVQYEGRSDQQVVYLTNEQIEQMYHATRADSTIKDGERIT